MAILAILHSHTKEHFPTVVSNAKATGDASNLHSLCSFQTPVHIQASVLKHLV